MASQLLLIGIYLGLYAALAMSLNLIAGYTGLLSLCHAAFFGIGAYLTAILMTALAVDFWLTLLLSGLAASLSGALIGLPTLRLKGDYLAIATLGFGEIIRNVIINWDAVTKGPMGIHGIPAPALFGFRLDPTEKWQYLVLVWLFALVTWLFLRRIVRSRFGRALEAIREDEIAASAMGIDVVKYKIFSFAVGAFFAGAAGSFWAVYLQSVSAGTFTFMLSVMILCMVVLGGMGNLLAAVLGAAIITLADMLPRLLSLTNVIPPELSRIFFGAVLVVMMIFRPQGLLGRRKPDFEELVRRHRPAGKDEP